jgi:glyoxylate/succinic semialdehyde reductase
VAMTLIWIWIWNCGHLSKDLRLALELAETLGQPSPIAAAVNSVYEKANSSGLGDKDFSAIIEALKADVKI